MVPACTELAGATAGPAAGRALMAEVELVLRGAGCPKINLQIRVTNHAAVSFYEALGYTTDDVISLGRRLGDETREALLTLLT